MSNILERRPIQSIAAILLGVGLGSAVLVGCGSNEPDPVTSSGTSGAAETTEARATECEELLDSVLAMIQPERLGFTTDSRSAIEILNEWVGECGAEGVRLAEPDPQTAAMLEQVLSEEARASLTSPRFVDRDAEFLRTATLLKGIGAHAVPTAEGDVDQVTQLFYYTMRNVAPLLEGEPVLPLTPFEILLFGRGSPEDRAWVFVELLRQQSIDAVVLAPETNAEEGEDDAPSPLLVGVLLEKGVYLFDPRLGLPIPSAQGTPDSPLVRHPATLAEVTANPELLRQLDIDEERPYALTVEELKSLKPHVVGYEPLWTERMKRLEQSLAGERALVVFDGLADSDSQRGLLTRVADAAADHWKRADLALWSYPQRGYEGLERLRGSDEGMDQQLAIRMLPFAAPMTLGFDEKQQKVVEGSPQRLQLKTRIAQLVGRPNDAVKSYQMVRIASKISPQLPVSSQTRLMHALAGEDAVYFVGIAQYEQGDYHAAAETFLSYLRNYGQGRWLLPAGLMRALSVAETGNYANAVKLISPLAENYPHERQLEILYRRWRDLRDASEEATDGSSK